MKQRQSAVAVSSVLPGTVRRSLAPLLTILLAAPTTAQLSSAALELGDPHAPTAIDADLVLFELTVTEPGGIWLTNQAGPFERWLYSMDVQWMSRSSDQQPHPHAGRWSLPHLWGMNRWSVDYVTQQQHLLPGQYLLAMAHDTHEPSPPPSPVIPRRTSTVFENASVRIRAIGYAAGIRKNPALDRPPFAGIALQPCDLTGHFPYATAPGAAPVTTAWLAGADRDTCSGVESHFGGPSIGFHGACSRWILSASGSASHAARSIGLTAFRQDLVIGQGTPLPDAVHGLCLLAVPFHGPAPAIDLDLAGLMPAHVAPGNHLRVLPDLILPMRASNPNHLQVSLRVPKLPHLFDVNLLVQSLAMDASHGLNISDLYAVRVR